MNWVIFHLIRNGNTVVESIASIIFAHWTNIRSFEQNGFMNALDSMLFECRRFSSIFCCIGLKKTRKNAGNERHGRWESGMRNSCHFLTHWNVVFLNGNTVYTNIAVRWHSAFSENGFSLSRLQPSIHTERFAVNAAHAWRVKDHRWKWQNLVSKAFRKKESTGERK